jgi:hypothetical protein
MIRSSSAGWKGGRAPKRIQNNTTGVILNLAARGPANFSLWARRSEVPAIAFHSPGCPMSGFSDTG